MRDLAAWPEQQPRAAHHQRLRVPEGRPTVPDGPSDRPGGVLWTAQDLLADLQQDHARPAVYGLNAVLGGQEEPVPDSAARLRLDSPV